MDYTIHYQHADAIVSHLNTIVPALSDDLLKAKYAGFVAVAAATVYEVAIKDIFISFAKNEHLVLGNLIENQFYRINGRISLDIIKEDYIKPLGSSFLSNFKKNIQEASNNYLMSHRRDIVSSYRNLILERHEFAHAGMLLGNSTYAEMVQSYEDGKVVIQCLAKTLLDKKNPEDELLYII